MNIAELLRQVASGGWKSPEWWTALASLAAAVAAVADPGLAAAVKAAVAGAGGLVIAAYTVASHQTRKAVATRAIDQTKASEAKPGATSGAT